MATTIQTSTKTVLVPTTVTEESLRIVLNLKAPEGVSRNDAVRFNNELIRLAKSRGWTPMKKSADEQQDAEQQG